MPSEPLEMLRLPMENLGTSLAGESARGRDLGHSNDQADSTPGSLDSKVVPAGLRRV